MCFARIYYYHYCEARLIAAGPIFIPCSNSPGCGHDIWDARPEEGGVWIQEESAMESCDHCRRLQDTETRLLREDEDNGSK
jgi:hypothetical protein